MSRHSVTMKNKSVVGYIILAFKGGGGAGTPPVNESAWVRVVNVSIHTLYVLHTFDLNV